MYEFVKRIEKTALNIDTAMKPYNNYSHVLFIGCIRRSDNSMGYQGGKSRNVSK